MSSNNSSLRRFTCLMVALVVAFGGAANAAQARPVLKLNLATPDSVSPGEEIALTEAIQNVGDVTTSGPITFVQSFGPGIGAPKTSSNPAFHTGSTSADTYVPVGATTCETRGSTITCVSPGPLPPGAQLFMYVQAPVEAGAEGLLSGNVAVSGGGAEPVQAEQRFTAGAPGPFGFTSAAAQLTNGLSGEVTQAGSDPAEFTTSLKWRSSTSPFQGSKSVLAPIEHIKDVTAHLPAGLIGNPSATPALCTPDELAEGSHEGVTAEGPPAVNISNCPLDSQIGVAHIYLTGATPEGGQMKSDFVGLYNMVAPNGVATELGFQIYQSNILLQAHVRPGDHGIDIVSNDTSTSAPVTGVDITVWGVPSDPSHDRYRGVCLESIKDVFEGPNGLVCPTAATRKAFLRMPTSCSGEPLSFGVETNSYEHPDSYVSASFTGPTLDGCDLVPFTPSIEVQPTATAASSPSGVSVKLSLPQTSAPDGLQEADLKKAVVTLPEGMVINPSAADGLQACDDAHLRLGSNTPAECPDGSKIGTVLLHTQLLPNPIEGNVYLRPQNSSDPSSGEMFRMALELRDDSHGLDIKVPGQIQANPVTGRLTTTFDENPQFPFEDISLEFKAGARAPLVTPPSCAPAATEAALSPYSAPEQPVRLQSSFTLSSGPEGTLCVGQQGFAPGFDAGVSNVEAGQFTSFLTTFKRSDADQSMQRVSVTLPAGIQAWLKGLPLCGEAQANAGTCSQSSEIGSVTAGAGAGPTPFYVTGGKVFMTGPYEGAPLGLSVVVPAKAGPFDLGTVVVRSKVEVDPHTAQVTVTTDPLPQIVSGVPVNLRLVNVTIDRPGFAFNPTNCDPLSVTGAMTGGRGATAHLENHFQVTNCGALEFQPQFTASTSGHTSRADGASLDVKLSYPTGAFGKDANVAKVKVALPRQLPSRLTTLQQACRDSVFDANPAACPPASRVATAKAIGPDLPVPFEGPAYFVSHGGAKFPELIIVLQGYDGIRIDLNGETFISKTGVTSSTFRAVPDAPVSTFELHLPQGPNSALAANGNLCDISTTKLVKRKVTVRSKGHTRTITRKVRKRVAGSLVMPTAFTAQNGAVIHQNTPITVTGCAHHKAKKAKAHRRTKHKKK